MNFLARHCNPRGIAQRQITLRHQRFGGRNFQLAGFAFRVKRQRFFTSNLVFVFCGHENSCIVFYFLVGLLHIHTRPALASKTLAAPQQIGGDAGVSEWVKW
jgi:hypothetical protein